ncbi:MAG: ribonuclease HI [Clostridiales bacterium]|nr:ribonuclease HI [Clostridiales bacterium]
MLKTVEIYTDGACSGNPGKGGWCAILMYGGKEKVLAGGEKETTNNRMEVYAAISGLAALKEKCNVNLYSDSAYLVNAIEQHWLDNWRRNAWRTADKKAVKNQDLWQRLYELMQQHNVSFIKVKGHADNEYNNRCDKAARAEIAKIED